jgi:hypothetical protein
LFAALREGFDVIIADTPPVGLVSDAYSLASYANITLYILRHLYTNKVYLKNVETMYQEKRFKNMTLLINGIVARREYQYNYGYGYDPEYGYGYKAGYHEDDEKPKKKVVTKGFKFWRSRRKNNLLTLSAHPGGSVNLCAYLTSSANAF